MYVSQIGDVIDHRCNKPQKREKREVRGEERVEVCETERERERVR